MSLDVTWHAGSPSPRADTAPAIQAHAYDDSTWILRQNNAVHYEAPFMFLLAGVDRCLLLDTGATAEAEHFPLRATVDELIGDRPLVVAHTHGHGDHVAADGQFADRPDTVVLGRGRDDVVAFFGLDWPAQGEFDLGDRVLDLIPGPGHHDAAVVFYDRRTELLLTGDTILPGRLIVDDWDEYVTTIDRVLAFCAEHPVRHVLGCHVELSRERGDMYPIGSAYHPDERPLQQTVEDIKAIRAALDVVGGERGVHVVDDVIIFYLDVRVHPTG
jgi:hydroxyacylglutathione hydrolase